MNFRIASTQDLEPIEKLLIRDGLIVPVPYLEIQKFRQETISVFCHKHAIYQLPTIELIDFLRLQIIGTAIEIGSGNGCIGRALGIKMTDNKMQTWYAIRRYYELIKQPVIKYGTDVIEMDANEAVINFQPQTVIGCWVIQRFKQGMVEGEASACVYGIDEELMFEHGIKKYIVVGNEGTHCEKVVFNSRKVERIYAPWLISRSMETTQNVIYIIT